MMKARKATQKDIQSTINWDSWTKGESEFPWYYDEKEICYILEGEATVTARNGNQISFKAGDWVEFEQGLSCTWKINKAIKKKYLLG